MVQHIWRWVHFEKGKVGRRTIWPALMQMFTRWSYIVLITFFYASSCGDTALLFPNVAHDHAKPTYEVVRVSDRVLSDLDVSVPTFRLSNIPLLEERGRVGGSIHFFRSYVYGGGFKTIFPNGGCRLHLQVRLQYILYINFALRLYSNLEIGISILSVIVMS